MSKFKEIKRIILLNFDNDHTIELGQTDETNDGKITKLECHIVAPQLVNIRKTILWSEGLQEGIHDTETITYSGAFAIHW